MPRTTGKEPQYVRAREAFFGCLKPGDDDTMVTVSPNEIIHADDPIVKKWPDKFIPLEPSRQRPSVEQATKAPGEQRPVKA